MKPKGGPRPGSGRPKIADKPAMKSVKLSSQHWDMAKALGGGNMAAGIRRALDAAFE